MRKTFIFFTLSLFFIGFGVNAQKMATAGQVPITKQVAQKTVGEKPIEKLDENAKLTKVYHSKTAKATIFSEDFSSGALPVDWANVDNGTSTVAWSFDNPGDRTINTTSNANGFAIIDSDEAGSVDLDGDLITPTMDLSANTNVFVEFEHYFRSYSTSSGAFSYSIDDGATWIEVSSWTGTSTDNAALFNMDLTTELAGQATVKLKWNYVGDYAYYWAIDDVKVYEAELYQFALTVPTGVVVEAGKSHYYTVSINNTGVNGDDFTPALTGSGAWTYELVDALDSSALVTPITIAAGASYDFVVKTTLPATGLVYGDTDTESMTVTSAETGKAVEMFDITTVALGIVQPPYTFDFADGYPAGGFTEDKGLLGEPTIFDTVTSSWTNDGFANVTATGSAKINLYGTSKRDWFFTPSYDLGSKSNFQLTFDLALTPWNGTTVAAFGVDDVFAVVVSTDNGATWTSANAILTYDGTHTFSLNEKVTLSLLDYSGVVKFGFYAESTVSNADNDLFVDNITVEAIPNNDLAILGFDFNSPAVASSPNEIEVVVQNNGLDLQAAGVTISITEDGMEVTTVQTTVDLAIGESETLYATYTPAATGTFTLGANVPAGDDNTTNDELTGTVVVIAAGQLIEDFEAVAFLPDGWTETATALNWGHSSPSDFYTIDGQSAYIVHDFESAEEMLITPQLTLDGSITELTYQAADGNGSYGLGSGIIQVKYSADGISWTVIGTPLVLDQAEPQTATVDLSSIPNGDYYFAFAATSDFNSAGYSSLTAIDNVQGPVVAGLSDNDLTLVDIVYPSDFVYAGDEITIVAKVKNVGLLAQTGTEVTLTVDGGTPLTAAIGTLIYGQSEMVEFVWTATVGRHTLVAAVAADDNAANNSYTMDVLATDNGLLTEGFEGSFAPAGWTADTDWVKWTQTWTPIHEGLAGAAAGNTAGFTDAILATPKVDLTGAKSSEELNFYAALGNAGVGAADLDIVYSADGITWTDLQVGIVPNETMDLYTIDLSGIPDGQYNLGFRASGSGDGTYATYIIIDNVVAPQMVTYDINFTVEDTDGALLDGVNININDTDLTTVAGLVSLTGLYPGDFDYTATKYWFDDAAGTVSISDADVDETVTMTLTSTYTVTFEVANDIAEPVEGATVSVNINGVDTEFTTDAAGVVSVDLMDGAYDYLVSMISHDDFSSTVTVSGADITEPVILTEHTYTVTFVVDDGTVPVDYAIITIDGQDLMTDVAGMAAIDLRNGEYGYSIDAGFCDVVTGTVTVNNVIPADIMVSMNCPETYSVTYTVNDGTDPLAGAVVVVGELEELTDVSGTAVFQLPNGVHPFSVDYGFAATYTGDVTVDNAPVFVPAISMVVPDTYTVTFAVTDDGAMPLEGATVNIIGEDISLTTDASGNAYTMLPEASFNYEVSLALYETITDVVEVPVDGITVPVEMTLMPYDVTFTVTDGTDAIANATVTVNGNDLVTDAAGVVIATDLPPASYDYTVVAAGYDDVTGAVVVVDQDVAEEVTMVLSVYDVAFTVTDGTDPIVGATVNVDGTDLTTDVDGMATIEGLLPGAYNYTVVAADYEDFAGTVTVVDMNVEESVEMTLIPLYNLVFTVDNANADLLEGATVTIDATDMMTDASGEATFVLLAGDYDYTIVLDGYADATGSVSIVDADVAEAITLIETIADPTDVSVEVDGFDATLTYDVPAGAVLTESFETAVPPTGWTLENANATTWAQSETVTFSDGTIVSPQDGVFQALLNWEYSAQDEWLITPSFNVPTGASVTFWSYSGAIGSTNGDHYYVKISTDGGSTWDILWDAVDNAADVYEEVNLALADYAGTDAMLAWQGVDGDGQGLWFTWFIDYITVGNAKEVVTFNDLQFVSKASGSSSVASDRTFSRDGSVVAISNKSAKAFVDYTIYLDDMTTPYAENVTENSFEFTALAEGSYTAGVQKVYATGVSEIVTVDFDIVIPVYEVTFNVSEARGPIEGATITINSTDITTDASGVATIELADGLYDYTVTAVGFEDYAEQITVAGAAVSVDVALIGIENVVSNFSIYPNPTSGILNVKAEGNNTVVVLNAIGQVVYTNEVDGEGTIDLTGNASGVYFVRLQSGDKVATQRVILE